MDSDEEDFKPSNSRLKNLFGAPAAKEPSRGTNDFSFQPPAKKKTSETLPDLGGGAGAPATTGGGGGQMPSLAFAPVVVFRDQQPVAKAMCALMARAEQPPYAKILAYDQQRKGVFQVQVETDLQFLQNTAEGAQAYCSVYDRSIQNHWTMQFKSPEDALLFSCSVMTAKYCLGMAEGGIDQPYFEVLPGDGTMMNVGDSVQMSYRVWSLVPVGSTMYKLGDTVDRSDDLNNLKAPITVKIGSGSVMPGLEDALVGCSKGCKRFVVILPEKSGNGGFGKIRPGDACAVLFTIVKTKSNAPAATPVSIPLEPDVVAQPAPFLQQQQPVAQPVVVTPQPTIAAAVAPQPVVAPVLSQDAAVLSSLLMSLQGAARPAVSPVMGGFDVERSLDRISMQLSSLYEKIDRQSIERQLEANNEKIEKMIKKAVGRAPTGELGINLSEDLSKDKDQLLFKIEQQSKRIEELTDTYHKSLEHISSMKDQISALQSDLSIERETTNSRLQDMMERKRLEAVEADVRFRRTLEVAVEDARRDAKEEGYKEGVSVGRLESIERSGGDPQMLQEQLLLKEQENINLKGEVSQLQNRLIQDRSSADERIRSMTLLLERFEERERTGGGGAPPPAPAQPAPAPAPPAEDPTLVLSRHLKKIMNNVYFAMEEQLNAAEKASYPTNEVLGVLTKVIKSQTKNALGWLKNEVDKNNGTNSGPPPPPPPPPPSSGGGMMSEATPTSTMTPQQYVDPGDDWK